MGDAYDETMILAITDDDYDEMMIMVMIEDDYDDFYGDNGDCDVNHNEDDHCVCNIIHNEDDHFSVRLTTTMTITLVWC